MPSLIETQASHLERLVVDVGLALSPPQHCAHTRNQLAGAERLHYVVVGADLEPNDAVGLLPARAQHDDRDLRAAPQLPADVVARSVGQPDVEQHQLGAELLCQLEAVGSRRGNRAVPPFPGECICQRLRDRGLVLDHQDRGAFLTPSPGS